MVIPAMQLAAKVPDVYLQLWSASLLKGELPLPLLYLFIFLSSKGQEIQCILVYK